MSARAPTEWFDKPGPRAGSRDAQKSDEGLRFQCTLCGHCCTGSAGYVAYTDEEAGAIAAHLGLPLAEFLSRYTHGTPHGQSLTERPSEFGLDCVFLDRETVPGKAVCGIYEVRPAQCRTWPFWRSVVSSEHAWRRAGVGCPGIDRGAKVIPPEAIRIQRARIEM